MITKISPPPHQNLIESKKPEAGTVKIGHSDTIYGPSPIASTLHYAIIQQQIFDAKMKYIRRLFGAE